MDITTHAAIIESRACRIADEQAAEMKRKLAGGLTPGYAAFKTAEELIAAEWASWFEMESRIYAT
jgi:hypothetical protein